MRNCDDEIVEFEKQKVRLDAPSRKDLFEKAKANRTRLKKGLADNNDPAPIGFHTQGGYAMKTITQHITGIHVSPYSFTWRFGTPSDLCPKTKGFPTRGENLHCCQLMLTDEARLTVCRGDSAACHPCGAG